MLHTAEAPLASQTGAPGCVQGAWLTARGVVAHDGVRGLYRGFGVVVFGMFPARMVSAGCGPAAQGRGLAWRRALLAARSCCDCANPGVSPHGWMAGCH